MPAINAVLGWLDVKGVFMWQVYAILSALFAALTAIFSKVGVDGMNSNLATAVRTLVILFITWGVVFFTVDVRELKDVPARTFAFLILSGMSTGLSWLFYFKALQVGVASKVAPVDKLSVVFTIILAYLFLGEPLTPKVALGGLLILGGSLVMII